MKIYINSGMCSLVQTRRRICLEVEIAYYMNLSVNGKVYVLWIMNEYGKNVINVLLQGHL